jgi:hypothetical protein
MSSSGPPRKGGFEPPPTLNPEFLLRGEQEATEGLTVSPAPSAREAEEPILSSASSSPSVKEIVALGAVDSLLYCKTWFPKTFRQGFGLYARPTWNILDDPNKRLCNIILPRGFAKTTNLRAFASKRIAYGISRTIVYIGKSERHARRSVRWLRTQVEKNSPWAKAFGLNKGNPWTDEELHILHGPEQHSIWVLALGISGSTRGINIDDYRPDLIIIDDVVDGENSATTEQREKIYDLVMADLKDSLAPASEAPDAKMVLLNTPQDFEDVSQRAINDNQFYSARFGCWTLETENLPTEFRISSWPERESSEVLRADREASIRRNKLSLFTKEKECKLISPETCFFRDDWVNYYGDGTHTPEPPRASRWVEIAIDPVPPPTEIQIKKGFAKKDYEAFVVACRHDGAYYILETVYNRGHEPNWTIATFFNLCIKYAPRKIIVETVAYQKTLEWLLRQAMRARGRYWVITPFDDRRAKSDVINDGLAGPASNGQLYFRKDQHELISQFLHYPGKNPDGDHDDVLNAAAIVISSLEKGNVSFMQENLYLEDEANILELDYERGAP